MELLISKLIILVRSLKRFRDIAGDTMDSLKDKTIVSFLHGRKFVAEKSGALFARIRS